MTLDPVRRKILWIEVAVVLCLFYLPSFATGLIDYLAPGRVIAIAWVENLNQTVSEVGRLVPILFIAWASGDSLRRFGLRSYSWWKTLIAVVGAALLGVLMWQVLSSIVMGYVAHDVNAASRYLFHDVVRYHRDPFNLALRIPNIAIGAFVEEFVMRGYLIARLRELLGQTWIAFLISSVLFASYHIYEGPVAIVGIFFDGCIFGGLLLATRSVWPGTIAHMIHNGLILIGWSPL